MSRAQRAAVEATLRALRPSGVVHGDCVGADAEFDRLAVGLGLDRTVRPCTLDEQRAHVERYTPVRPSKIFFPEPPLDRNKKIVADCDVLIACPGEATEQLRSGTWATIRHAKRVGKPCTIVYPSGEVQNG